MLQEIVLWEGVRGSEGLILHASMQKLGLNEIFKYFLLYISDIFMGLKRGGCASPCSCVLVYGGTFGGPTGGVSGETSEVKDWS